MIGVDTNDVSVATVCQAYVDHGVNSRKKRNRDGDPTIGARGGTGRVPNPPVPGSEPSTRWYAPRPILNRKRLLSRPKTETSLMTRSDTHTHENGVESAQTRGAGRAHRRGRHCAWCHRARERARPRPRFRTHTLSPPRSGEHAEDPVGSCRGRLVPRAGREPSQPHRRADESIPSSPPLGGRRPAGGPTGGAFARPGRNLPARMASTSSSALPAVGRPPWRTNAHNLAVLSHADWLTSR